MPLVMDVWNEVQRNTPFGSLPIMHIDGKLASQSLALLRYVGKLTGLYPEDALQALEVDEILEVIGDINQSIYIDIYGDKDFVRQSREKLVVEVVPRYVGGLEKRLESFGKGPWAVGDKLTIADLIIAVLVITLHCGVIGRVPVDVLTIFPRVMASYESVMAIPKVVEWYKKYPIITKHDETI